MSHIPKLLLHLLNGLGLQKTNALRTCFLLQSFGQSCQQADHSVFPLVTAYLPEFSLDHIVLIIAASMSFVQYNILFNTEIYIFHRHKNRIFLSVESWISHSIISVISGFLCCFEFVGLVWVFSLFQNILACELLVKRALR